MPIKKRFRSAPYPAIILSKAIERANSLHINALHHSVPMVVVAEAWSYTVKSSGLFGAIAALKQYGLVLDEGTGQKRRFRLTDDAMRIIKDPDSNSEKRNAALSRCALSPIIYKELWEKFGVAGASGKTDMLIKTHLTLDRAEEGHATYSDGAADDIISGYQKTATFAGLLNHEDLSSERNEVGKDVSDFDVGLGDNMETSSRNKIDKTPSGGLLANHALNDIRAELGDGKVRIEAILDIEGLEKLEKQIAAFKALLS